MGAYFVYGDMGECVEWWVVGGDVKLEEDRLMGTSKGGWVGNSTPQDTHSLSMNPPSTSSTDWSIASATSPSVVRSTRVFTTRALDTL